MRIRKPLQQLRAAAVPVHVPKPADVHQNVELECRPGMKPAQQPVMPPALPRAQLNQLRPPGPVQPSHHIPQLPIRKMTVRIDERSRQLHLERFLPIE